MPAEQEEIKKTQKAWAKSEAIIFDLKGYVSRVEDNLWRSLSCRARRAFEKGAVSERSLIMKFSASSSNLNRLSRNTWDALDLGVSARVPQRLKLNRLNATN